jgi:hypothetical protein
VQYCDSGLPVWLLLTCRQYPTASLLARSQLKTLAEIPHVGVAKAEQLRAAAKTSTAALDDAGTAAAMSLLVEELLHHDKRIAELQSSLISMMKDDPNVARLDGIPGIGPWSAVALTLEIGDPERFADVRQVIAWAGLDPRVDTSGDQSITRGISHRGNAYLRAMLFPLAMAAMQHNPVVGDFIRKKMAEGKPKKVAMVAGAAKLLRIAFALLISKKDYDPNHEKQRAAVAAAQLQKNRQDSPAVVTPSPPSDLTAPISGNERRRRKAQAIASQTATQKTATNKNAAAQRSHGCEVEPQKRDPRATAPTASAPPT